jgi:biopolymer transport protein ExbD
VPAIVQKGSGELKLNLSPMIDVVFLILIYFIVSMQMEPSLDNIIKLAPVLRASRQEDALLQIYILPAKVDKYGNLDPDSTGLIAFSDKAKTPDTCALGHRILDERGDYIPNALVDGSGNPIPDLQKAKAAAFKENAPPPVFMCARYAEHPDQELGKPFPPSAEVGPYLKLAEVPWVLAEKKKEVFEIMLANRNARRARNGEPALTEAQEKELEESIPLMIKADRNTFYGRILQVVNMSKMEPAEIKNFAFVTLPEASAEVQAKLAEQSENE